MADVKLASPISNDRSKKVSKHLGTPKSVKDMVTRGKVDYAYSFTDVYYLKMRELNNHPQRLNETTPMGISDSLTLQETVRAERNRNCSA